MNELLMLAVPARLTGAARLRLRVLCSKLHSFRPCWLAVQAEPGPACLPLACCSAAQRPGRPSVAAVNKQAVRQQQVRPATGQQRACQANSKFIAGVRPAVSVAEQQSE